MRIKNDDMGNTFFRDDNGKYHRDDGPAIILNDGSITWFKHGDRHREDGPAHIDKANGIEEWYLDGDYLTKEEHTLKLLN